MATITHNFVQVLKEIGTSADATHIKLEFRATIKQDTQKNRSVITDMGYWFVGKGDETITFGSDGVATFRHYAQSGKSMRYELSSGVSTGDRKLSVDSYYELLVLAWRDDTESYLHNADGSLVSTLNVSKIIYGDISGSIEFGTTYDINIPIINLGRDILTSNNFNDEENPTITFEPDFSTNAWGINGYYIELNTVSLQAAISFDGITDDIPYRDLALTATSYTFNFTDAEREILRQKVQGSTTAQVYFLLKTVRTGLDSVYTYEEVFVEKSLKYLTITDCIPVLVPVVRDVNEATVALTGDDKVLVKNFSNARAVMTIWTQKSATLIDYYIKNGTNKVKETTYTFNGANYNVFDFYVLDSRNEYNSNTITLRMIDYIKLTCNLKENKPATNGTVSVECSGNYFNQSFGAVHNSITVQYRYKELGGAFGNWVSMNVTTSGNTYEAAANLTGLDYKKTYVFETRATDKLTTISSGESAVKSLPVFHWSGTDFVHETPVEFKDVIKGDVQITGNLRLKNPDSNYGNKILLGDSSYVSFSEDTDDDLTIKATEINLSAQKIALSSNIDLYGGLTLNGGSIACGTWTPTLNVSGAVSSYTTRQGWYLKLGTTVIIGFNIKAVCNSGYNSSAIAVNGAPFTPSYDAFGGGVAFNIYINGGFNFEAWAINTSGVITPRLQPCNNTAAGNLNISSSAYYPSGSGTVTLGGTIVYQTTD